MRKFLPPNAANLFSLISVLAVLAPSVVEGAEAPQIPRTIVAGPISGSATSSCGVRLLFRTGVEQRADCDEAFEPAQPPPFELWIEDGKSIAAAPIRIESLPAQGVPFRLELRSAGEVSFRRSRVNPAEELQLIQIADRPAYYRVRMGEELAQPTLFPAGQAVAALWDREKKRYLGLSGPFTVVSGQTVEVGFEDSARRSALLVRLDHGSADSSSVSAQLSVKQGEAALPADALLRIWETTFAFWFNLPTLDTVIISAETNTQYLPPSVVNPLRGQVVHLDAEMLPKPALSVELNLPDGLAEGGLALELRRQPGDRVISQIPVAAGQKVFRFEALVPGSYEVHLLSAVGLFKVPCDVVEADTWLVLEPKLVHLFGTVQRGEAPLAAKLEFEVYPGERIEAQADEKGHYDVLMLRAPGSVRIFAPDGGEEPFWDFFTSPPKSEERLDFSLPEAEVTVRVLDTSTGQPIRGANIAARNHFATEKHRQKLRGPNAGSLPATDKMVMQTAATNEDGLALLPPIRSGQLQLKVSAPGYQKSSAPIELVIPEGTSSRVVDVRLEKEKADLEIRLLLPNGAPAAVAVAQLVEEAPSSERAIWSGVADRQGMLHMPRDLRGLLLIRHVEAGFFFDQWPLPGDRQDIDLPPLAPPLQVRVLSAEDGKPVVRARLEIELKGRWLGSSLLGFLGNAVPTTDEHGFWTLSFLPPESLTISIATAGPEEAPALRPIDYPWPLTVEITLP